MQTILVVDDDILTANSLAVALRRDGYDVLVAGSGLDALLASGRQTPQCVILELRLPDMSSIEVCRDLRRLGPMTVIFLTSVVEEAEKAAALGAGGDEYMIKPVSVPALLGLVRQLLHDPGPSNPEAPDPSAGVRTTGEVRLDRGTGRVSFGLEEVRLSPRELQVLEVLLQQAGRVVPAAQIVDRVWGPGAADEQVLELFIRSLQEKIRGRLHHGASIEEVAGTGYRFITS